MCQERVFLMPGHGRHLGQQVEGPSFTTNCPDIKNHDFHDGYADNRTRNNVVHNAVICVSLELR